MIGQSGIRKALVEALEALSLGIPLNYPNTPVKTATDGSCGDVSFVWNRPEVFTLGDNGEDMHTGFCQVLLKFPSGKGDSALLAKADLIREGFSAGSRKFYMTQEVVIENCGMGDYDTLDGKFVCPITIYWYAKTRR
jgi:hypothetical protein